MFFAEVGGEIGVCDQSKQSGGVSEDGFEVLNGARG